MFYENNLSIFMFDKTNINFDNLNEIIKYINGIL